MGIQTVPTPSTVSKWAEIATASPTTGTTVTFSSIPEYKDLKLELIKVTTVATTQWRWRINNDTGVNYAQSYLIRGTQADYGGSANQSFFALNNPNQNTDMVSGEILIENANQVSKTITGWRQDLYNFGSFWFSQSIVNQLDIIITSSSFSGGTIKLYGRN